MRLIIISLTAAAALAAGPGFAQDQHAAHHPAAAAGAKAAPAGMMHDMDPAAMHEMCKSVMGKKMDPKSVHEHSREKGGMAMWPNGKPLTKDEMAKMHQQCAAMMDAHDATSHAPATPK